MAKVRRVFMTKAVGHAGTLDPMADGLLILLLGDATKFSNYIMGQDKKYSAEIQLGLETDSWDADGALITDQNEFKSKNLDLTETVVQQAVNFMQGDLALQVPIHSAVKIQGQKLYEYARKGKAITAPTRIMKFYKSELKTFVLNSFFIEGQDYKVPKLEVDLDCEKGSYIRSWVHHLGKNLGCGALMSGLTRHQSGAFNLDQAVDYKALLKIDQYRQDLKKEALNIPLKNLLETEFNQLLKEIIDLQTCIKGPFFRSLSHEVKLLRNGQIPNDLNLRLRPILKNCQNTNTSQLVRIFDESLTDLIAILELNSTGRPKIIRALQN